MALSGERGREDLGSYMFIRKIWLAAERRVALASNHVGLRSCRLVGIPINLEVWHFLDCFDFHSPPYFQTFKLTGVGEGNCPSHSFHCFCVKWTNIIGGIFLSGCFLRSSFSNFGWDAEPANYSLLKKRGEGGSSYLSFDFFFSFLFFGRMLIMLAGVGWGRESGEVLVICAKSAPTPPPTIDTSSPARFMGKQFHEYIICDGNHM